MEEEVPNALVYVGLVDKAPKLVRFARVAGDGKEFRLSWIFNIHALKTRISNRKKLKLPIIEEEMALADLKGVSVT